MTLITNFLQSLVRRQDSLWKLAFIVVIAFFSAKAINLFVAQKMLPLDLSSMGSLPSRRSSADFEKGPRVNPELIRSRNIFDSQASSRLAPPSAAGPVSGAVTPSTLPLELMGTVVFRKAKFSVALIKDRNANKFSYYGIDDQVMGASLRRIERFKVILENNGRLESLEIKEAESKLKSMMQPKLFSPLSPSPSAGSGSAFDEIGPGKFAVPRNVIDETMANFGQILTQARMVPNITPDNKTDGFKIFQIKPGSIFEKMGLKDQDVLKRVNGQDLDSMEKSMGLFGALRNEKTISIDIVRNGTRLNYTYEIQ